MLYLSKGVPYSSNSEIVKKVWKDGKIVILTQEQWLIWKFFYGSIKSHNELMKFIYWLFKNNIAIISKQKLNQTINQLKSLDLLSFVENDNKIFGEFLLICKNKIKVLKEVPNINGFEKKLYEYIKEYDNFHVADFLVQYNNVEYNFLTNGIDDKYLEYAFNLNYRKNTVETIKDFLKIGIFYIC